MQFGSGVRSLGGPTLGLTLQLRLLSEPLKHHQLGPGTFDIMPAVTWQLGGLWLGVGCPLLPWLGPWARRSRRQPSSTVRAMASSSSSSSSRTERTDEPNHRLHRLPMAESSCGTCWHQWAVSARTGSSGWGGTPVCLASCCPHASPWSLAGSPSRQVSHPPCDSSAPGRRC